MNDQIVTQKYIIFIILSWRIISENIFTIHYILFMVARKKMYSIIIKSKQYIKNNKTNGN